METKHSTTQYRAEITLPDNTECAITSDNPNNLKESIQRLVEGKVRFEQVNPHTTFVFHPDWGKGQTPLGYINQQEVPIELGVASLVESRVARAA